MSLMREEDAIEKVDNINPNHYKNGTSLECIEAMMIVFGKEKVLDFCVCNAWKYIWRWKNKNGIEDLEKATWYVDTGIHLTTEIPDSNEVRNIYDILGNIRHYIQHEFDNWKQL